MECWGVMPIRGLGDLGNESRIIPTPWSRMVRGLGLGQYPVGYEPAVAGYMRQAFDLLASKHADAGGYMLFCKLLGDFILKATPPSADLSRWDVVYEINWIKSAIRSEPNPYYRVVAGCILMDSLAKLELNTTLLTDGANDFAQEILSMIGEIGADNIQDSNLGRHGDYEKIFAYTALLLCFHHLDIRDRLVSKSTNIIVDALRLLDGIPAPFFRGRGGSMLFSAISLIGYDTLIFDGERNYFREIFDYMDSSSSIDIPVTFPQDTTFSFQRMYPLVTMLNAVAVSNRSQYLLHGRDRLKQLKSYWSELAPPERAHMSLYYVMALYNLGRLQDEIPDLGKWVEELVSSLEVLDPGADFFLHGLSNAYIIETAMITGRMDLIAEEKLHRLVDCFADLDRTEADRINRPYPFSYALNVLGEIGQLGLLFKPRKRYCEMSPIEWTIAHLSDGGRAEGNRLFMLGNALLSQTLRLRYVRPREISSFEKFRFKLV